MIDFNEIAWRRDIAADIITPEIIAKRQSTEKKRRERERERERKKEKERSKSFIGRCFTRLGPAESRFFVRFRPQFRCCSRERIAQQYAGSIAA